MSSSIILYLEFFLAFGKNARNDVSINLGGCALESRQKIFRAAFVRKMSNLDEAENLDVENFIRWKFKMKTF